MNIRIDSELKKQFEAFFLYLQKSIAQLESTGGTVHEVNLDD